MLTPKFNSVPEAMTTVNKGSPPLGDKIFGTVMSDTRKQGNPHSTDRYIYGKI